MGIFRHKADEHIDKRWERMISLPIKFYQLALPSTFFNLLFPPKLGSAHPWLPQTRPQLAVGRLQNCSAVLKNARHFASTPPRPFFFSRSPRKNWDVSGETQDMDGWVHIRDPKNEQFFFFPGPFWLQLQAGWNAQAGASSLVPAGIGHDLGQRRRERPGAGDGRGRQLEEGAAKGGVGRNGQHLAPLAWASAARDWEGEASARGASGTVVAKMIELPTTATHAGSGGQGQTQAAEEGDTENIIPHVVFWPRG